MAIFIGRANHCVYNPNSICSLLTTPTQPQTFKLIIGWRNHRDCGIDP
jgi:hypothetical protein